jgi:glycerol-3-phosphate dehydrogenase
VGVLQEALEERYHMLNAAPYMNHPLPIMLPLYE